MPSKSHPVNQNANIAVNESHRNRWNIATARVTKFTNDTVFICERRSQLSRVIVLIVAELRNLTKTCHSVCCCLRDLIHDRIVLGINSK